MALMSLVGANSFTHGARVRILTVMGLLGASLIYGDGVITPAISVLSAVEGVNVVSDVLKPFVMPIAVLILAGLFAAQRFGTEKIGSAFGPIMLLWFSVIGLLGISGIVRNPHVLVAVNPVHAVEFMAHHREVGFLVLGGVFLCITGAEALYADMGHLGRGPIRRSWYGVVLPALLLCYAGQTALLIEKQTVTGNPFFQLAPSWAVYPVVVLATIATVIASQAIITGSFSMTRQAMQLGWLPGVNIRQTSDETYGQIYVPAVNWLMMVATVAIAMAFGSSDKLAGAYGTAVSTTMLLTTCLLYAAMRRIWRWSLRGVLRCRRCVPGRGPGVLLCESAEDRGRRLVATDSGCGRLFRHEHLAVRSGLRARGTGEPRGFAQVPRRFWPLARSRVCRVRYLPHEIASDDSAADDLSCGTHGLVARAGGDSDRCIRRDAAG